MGDRRMLEEAQRFTHGRPMGRMRSQDKPEPLYPPDARTELLDTEIDREGFEVKTYRVFKNDDTGKEISETYRVRTKAGKPKKAKHVYPIDANRRILSRTLDHEGFTVTVYRLTSEDGEECDMTVRTKQN